MALIPEVISEQKCNLVKTDQVKKSRKTRKTNKHQGILVIYIYYSATEIPKLSVAQNNIDSFSLLS